MNVQESQEFFEKQMDVIKKQVNAALPEGQESHVYYSAYPFNHDTDVITNNLDDVAILGQIMMVQEYDKFWDDDREGETYRSAPMNNPTWLELAVAANVMIITTQDLHHRFFEGIRNTNTEIDGLQVFSFVMGS